MWSKWLGNVLMGFIFAIYLGLSVVLATYGAIIMAAGDPLVFEREREARLAELLTGKVRTFQGIVPTGKPEVLAYTPGPWSVGFECNGWEDGGIVVLADGMGMVCAITEKLEGLRQGDGKRTLGNQEANARLISAAPDLLKACELVEMWMLGGQPGPHSDSLVLEQVRLAIQKAKGTKNEN